MRYLALFFIILTFVVLGCTQQTQEAIPEGESIAFPEQQGAGAVEQTEAKPSVNLSSFDLAAFVKSDTPIKCEIETSDAGTVKNEVLYIKGNQIRVEALVPGTSQTRLEFIMKGTDVYVPQIESPDCDWLNISPKNDTTGNAPASDALKGFEAPPMNYSCNADVFGDEKFDISGKICNFWDMMPNTSSPN
jgi:hypothetical protein